MTINNFDNFDATAPASLGSNIICGDDGGEDTHRLAMLNGNLDARRHSTTTLSLASLRARALRSTLVQSMSIILLLLLFFLSSLHCHLWWHRQLATSLFFLSTLHCHLRWQPAKRSNKWEGKIDHDTPIWSAITSSIKWNWWELVKWLGIPSIAIIALLNAIKYNDKMGTTVWQHYLNALLNVLEQCKTATGKPRA